MSIRKYELSYWKLKNKELRNKIIY